MDSHEILYKAASLRILWRVPGQAEAPGVSSQGFHDL